MKKLSQYIFKMFILTKKTKSMRNIDLQKPVKLIHPQPGEEYLIYKIVNFNEVTNRCYIEPINLKNWEKYVLPQELVSIDDIEAI